MFDQLKEGPGTRFLFVLALGVIVTYGLKTLAPILLPFSVALFLAVITLPVMLWLNRHGVRASLAILFSVLLVVGVFGLVVLLASQSAAEFEEAFPRYASQLQVLLDNGIAALQARGVPLGETLPRDVVSVMVAFFDPGQVLDIAGSALTFLGSTFLVLLIMVFILAEATIFPAKFRAILGRRAGAGNRLQKITHEIQAYLGIKTLVSLATGLLLGLWAWALGLDFPVLLGLTAFVLNYVPTIGSVIAAIPALFLALIDGGVGFAFFTGLGYVAVNLVFGNIIEPNLLGRRLGLSTLVVVLSLLFWNWAWGPVGALLSVPLTMMVKIMLENTEDLRWVAVLLDKAAPSPSEGTPRGAPATPPADAAASASRPAHSEVGQTVG